MHTNIRGLVERLELAGPRGMMPLFEAVSNSIDAIQEKGRGAGVLSGTVRIRLIAAPDLAQQAGDETLMVDGFEVIDDGVGFNDANMASFGEAYTLSKVTVGGKGVGRFTFLKVFSRVMVRSVFERNGKRFVRTFSFSIDSEVSDEIVEPTKAPTGTTISLPSFTTHPSSPCASAQGSRRRSSMRCPIC